MKTLLKALCTENIKMKLYEKHIFVCVNQRQENARACCGEEIGNAIAARFKQLISEHKLRMKVRAQRTSCFDWCEQGPIVTIYPDKTVYGNISVKDVDEIFNSHILNNKPVERLKTTFS